MIYKKLIIISNYPNSEEIKDGMMQRVANIDNYFLNYNRDYLEIGIKNHFEGHIKQINSNTTEYRFNFLKHYFFIVQILKNSESLYVHSIFNFFKLLPFFPFIFKKNIILDFHGVVPEELKYHGKRFKSLLFSLVEYIAIKSSNHVIFVTKSMEKYIFHKYKSKKYTSHILNVFSKNVFNESRIEELENLRKRYKIDNKDVVFIYVGNTQKWQNIELMLSVIDKVKNVQNYKFFILTGAKEIMFNRLGNLLNQPNVFLETVSPKELSSYYLLSHYGFVLRDEHILNSVANPTKLVEYMWYGLVPIVKYQNLGDYQELGYEYIEYDKITPNLKQKKSLKNSKIVGNFLNIKFDMDLIVNDFIEKRLR